MNSQKPPSQDASCLQANFTIVNKRGLHARASARFVKLVNSFDANIMVSKDKTEVLGSSIMGLLLLAAAKGDVISVKASGPQAQEALTGLKKLIENKFDEDN